MMCWNKTTQEYRLGLVNFEVPFSNPLDSGETISSVLSQIPQEQNRRYICWLNFGVSVQQPFRISSALPDYAVRFTQVTKESVREGLGMIWCTASSSLSIRVPITCTYHIKQRDKSFHRDLARISSIPLMHPHGPILHNNTLIRIWWPPWMEYTCEQDSTKQICEPHRSLLHRALDTYWSRDRKPGLLIWSTGSLPFLKK